MTDRLPSEVDDRLRADEALARLRQGERLLYTGDFRNARQLLAALTRRLERKRKVQSKEPRDHFFADRENTAQTAEVLSRLLVGLCADGQVKCANAPNVREAAEAAWGAELGERVVSLRELLGVIGAYEWQVKGIEVKALGTKVHPHYGVFGPVRQEYVDLVAEAPDVNGKVVIDVGTGTGVLALLLAKKGAQRVIATDLDEGAVRCAQQNVARFGLQGRIEVVHADLFPEAEADVIVMNPPWLPAKPKTRIDRAIYDEGGKTVARFLEGVGRHLSDGGEAWLVISDLAERLGIRRPGLLEELWTKAGLSLRWKRSTTPTHPRSKDRGDPLYEARSGEVTTLYALGR